MSNSVNRKSFWKITFILLLVILLFSIVGCGGGEYTPPTEIATQIATEAPIVEMTQAPATQEATEIAPSMENLPAEWQGKIDRVETMKNMDGTERIVAIEKVTQPATGDKVESKLRVLEWDGSEWALYTPQVGWAGYGEETIDGVTYPSLWIEDIQLLDSEDLAAPLRMSDGRELPVSEWLGIMRDSGSNQNSTNTTEYIQGYVLEVRVNKPNPTTNKEYPTVYMGFPLDTGDWQVFLSIIHDENTNVGRDLILESLQMSGEVGAPGTEMTALQEQITQKEIYDYLLDHGQDLVGQPVIQGIMFDGGSDGAKRRLVEAVINQGPPINSESMYQAMSSWILPRAMWNQIKNGE